MSDQLNMPTKNQFPSMSSDPSVPGNEDDGEQRENLTIESQSNRPDLLLSFP